MTTRKKNPLETSVRECLLRYFDDLGDSEPGELWNMVMHLVERPVLEVIMERTGSNQSHAAEILGITRNTLRKKLIAHDLLS